MNRLTPELLNEIRIRQHSAGITSATRAERDRGVLLDEIDALHAELADKADWQRHRIRIIGLLNELVTSTQAELAEARAKIVVLEADVAHYAERVQ